MTEAKWALSFWSSSLGAQRPFVFFDGPGIFRCIKLSKIMVEYSNNPENRKFVYIDTLLYVLAGFCFSIFEPWVIDIFVLPQMGL
jgi:hypothetical protein